MLEEQKQIATNYYKQTFSSIHQQYDNHYRKFPIQPIHSYRLKYLHIL